MPSRIRIVVPLAAELDPCNEPSPAAILRKQAAIWTERTHGAIVGDVEPTRASDEDRIAYAFGFVVPALADFRYRLLRVEHGPGFYPLRIFGRNAVVDVADEDSFYDALRTLFAAPATLYVVRQLRSMLDQDADVTGKLPSR
jgi:hypothetical protein